VTGARLCVRFMSPANPLRHDRTEAGAPDAPEEALSLLRSAAELFALKAEWLDLWGRAPNSAFTQGPAWAEASWQAVSLPLGRRLLCVVGRTRGRLTMLWPLVSYRDRGLTIVRPLGPEAAEYSSMLIEPAPSAAARIGAAFRLLRRESGCDLLLAP